MPRHAICSNCRTEVSPRQALTNARLIYFSGITLSLYSNIGLGRFLAAVELALPPARRSPSTATSVRMAGMAISRARAPFCRSACKRVDIALPAYEQR